MLKNTLFRNISAHMSHCTFCKWGFIFLLFCSLGVSFILFLQGHLKRALSIHSYKICNIYSIFQYEVCTLFGVVTPSYPTAIKSHFWNMLNLDHTIMYTIMPTESNGFFK